jgi:hypothetical protein
VTPHRTERSEVGEQGRQGCSAGMGAEEMDVGVEVEVEVEEAEDGR